MISERTAAPPRKKVLSPRERFVPLALSGVSVVIFFGFFGWLVTSAEAWPRIQSQFFSLEAMGAAFPKVAQGFLINM